MPIKNIYFIVSKNKLQLLLIILIIFSFPQSNNSSFSYFHAKTIYSEKILVINENGISTYNQDFKEETIIKNFSENPFTQNKENIETQYITISQFDNDENRYIICRVKNKLYFFSDKNSEDNILLYEYTNNNITDVKIEIINSVYENLNLKKIYYFFICYVKDYILYVEKYNFINENSNFSLIKTNQIAENSIKYGEGGLNCQTMHSNINNYDFITCFLPEISPGNNLVVYTFDFYLNKNISLSSCTKENLNINSLKGVTNKNKTKTLICYVYDNTYCIIYDINTNSFSNDIKFFTKCYINPDTLLLNYIEYKKEFVFSCKKLSENVEIMILDENFNIKSNNDNYTYCYNDHKIENCSYSYSYDLLYLSEKNDYYILSTCNDNITYYQSTGKCNIETDNIDFYNFTYNSSSNNTPNYNNSDQISNNTNNNSTNFTFINDDFYIKNNIVIGKTNLTKDQITKNLEQIINEIEIGKKYEVSGEDYDIKISPINDQINQNTHVDFSICENILRNENKILNDSILTVLQIEINKKNEQILNNQVEYAIFDQNKNKLDLSKCKNVKIKINYQISNQENLDISTIKYYSDMGIDIFNINENFFQDICYSYSINKSDIILKDRVVDIYQNYSLCDNNCTYNNINMTSMEIMCECEIKTEINTEIEKPKFASMVKSTFEDFNVDVIKCYELVFNFNNKISNKGFWLFLSFIVLQIPMFIHYSIYCMKPLSSYIYEEMEKYDYLISKNRYTSPPKKNSMIISNIKKNCKKSKSISTKINPLKLMDKSNSNKIIINNSSVINQSVIQKNNSPTKKKKSIASKNEREMMNSNIDNFICNYSSSKRKKKFLKKRKLTKNIKINKNNKVCGYDNLIHFNSNTINYKSIPPQSNYVLNCYTIKEAQKYDNRSFWKIYWINLINTEIILHTFFFNCQLEPRSLRFIYFIFKYSAHFAFNALFYFNKNISDKYHYTEDNLYLYCLINNMIICIISALLVIVLFILKKLIHSKYTLENVFREEEMKMKTDKKYKITNNQKNKISQTINKIIKNLKIKVIIFLIIDIIFLLFFAYFVIAFCSVYEETQISWVLDSIASFIYAFIVELVLTFINATLYVISVTNGMSCLYNISLFIYKNF